MFFSSWSRSSITGKPTKTDVWLNYKGHLQSPFLPDFWGCKTRYKWWEKYALILITICASLQNVSLHFIWYSGISWKMTTWYWNMTRSVHRSFFSKFSRFTIFVTNFSLFFVKFSWNLIWCPPAKLSFLGWKPANVLIFSSAEFFGLDSETTRRCCKYQYEKSGKNRYGSKYARELRPGQGWPSRIVIYNIQTNFQRVVDEI